MTWIKYFYWKLYYYFFPINSSFSTESWQKWLMRTFRPGPFFPYCYNHDRIGWKTAYFDGEADYTVPGEMLRIDLHIGQESGKLVGITIKDCDFEEWLESRPKG